MNTVIKIDGELFRAGDIVVNRAFVVTANRATGEVVMADGRRYLFDPWIVQTMTNHLTDFRKMAEAARKLIGEDEEK